MLPRSVLSFGIRDDTVVPRYLTHRDEVWVRELMGELDALVGRTHGEADRVLGQKLATFAAVHGAPVSAVGAVRYLLQKLWRTEVASPVPPADIRRVVFELAADPVIEREQVWNRAAAMLGVRSEQIAESLFADRPSERRLVAPREVPPVQAVVEMHNLALVQGLLMRSEHVVAFVRAHVRSVVRFAKLRGLLCSYAIGGGGTKITLSGPLALFRHTLKYGQALASFFPAVAVTAGWSVEARCQLGACLARFHVDASDPIGATHVLPRDTDSLLEKRLQRDFRHLGTPWSIRRETIAVQVGAGAFFPDFTLERGRDRVYVEVIGFYTPEYLTSKLAALRQANLANVIVCIDESLACSEGEIAADEVLRFRRRVDARALLNAAERCAGPSILHDDTRPEGS